VRGCCRSRGRARSDAGAGAGAGVGLGCVEAVARGELQLDHISCLARPAPAMSPSLLVRFAGKGKDERNLAGPHMWASTYTAAAATGLKACRGRWTEAYNDRAGAFWRGSTARPPRAHCGTCLVRRLSIGFSRHPTACVTTFLPVCMRAILHLHLHLRLDTLKSGRYHGKKKGKGQGGAQNCCAP
jgi:hypothetical protein